MWLLMFAAGMLATFSLSAIATEASATPGNSTEQRVEGNKQEGLANTTLQQRIEMRKKTKAHWRDPPVSDRASRLKAKRELLEQNTGQTGPAKQGTTSTPQ